MRSKTRLGEGFGFYPSPILVVEIPWSVCRKGPERGEGSTTNAANFIASALTNMSSTVSTRAGLHTDPRGRHVKNQHHFSGSAARAFQTTLKTRQGERRTASPHQCFHIESRSLATFSLALHRLAPARGAAGNNGPTQLMGLAHGLDADGFHLASWPTHWS
jgi:hypothetical protein